MASIQESVFHGRKDMFTKSNVSRKALYVLLTENTKIIKQYKGKKENLGHETSTIDVMFVVTCKNETRILNLYTKGELI